MLLLVLTALEETNLDFFIPMADFTDNIPDQRHQMRKEDVPMWIFRPLR